MTDEQRYPLNRTLADVMTDRKIGALYQILDIDKTKTGDRASPPKVPKYTLMYCILKFSKLGHM